MKLSLDEARLLVRTRSVLPLDYEAIAPRGGPFLDLRSSRRRVYPRPSPLSRTAPGPLWDLDRFHASPRDALLVGRLSFLLLLLRFAHHRAALLHRPELLLRYSLRDLPRLRRSHGRPPRRSFLCPIRCPSVSSLSRRSSLASQCLPAPASPGFRHRFAGLSSFFFRFRSVMDSLGPVSPVPSSGFSSPFRSPSLRCPLSSGYPSVPSLPDCGSLLSRSSPAPSSEPSSAGLQPLSSLRLSSASSGRSFYPGKRCFRGPGRCVLSIPSLIRPPQWRAVRGSLDGSPRKARRPPTQGPSAVPVRSSFPACALFASRAQRSGHRCLRTGMQGESAPSPPHHCGRRLPHAFCGRNPAPMRSRGRRCAGVCCPRSGPRGAPVAPASPRLWRLSSALTRGILFP